jgi:hypothetical protein
MRRFALLPLVVALFAGVPTTSGAATSPPVSATTLRLFVSETVAQAHCPKDEVVWLNTASGIYHEKGMRWYGRTRHGAYVCRKEADAVGDRDTRNGQ